MVRSRVGSTIHRKAFAACVALFLAACAEAAIVRPTPRPDDEPQVIAAALDSLFSWAEQIFVEPQTFTHLGPPPADGGSAEVLRSFSTVTLQAAKTPLPLPTRARTRVFSEEERERVHARARTVINGEPAIIVDDVWALLRRDHPRTAMFVAFTNVAFNTSRTEALLYVTIVCGPLCGSGNYVHLERTGTRWVVKRIVMSWVS
jgi:hypothetical protein